MAKLGFIFACKMFLKYVIITAAQRAPLDEKRYLEMTKKKSVLLQVLFALGMGVTLVSVLALTGCSNRDDGECVTLAKVRDDVPFNGDENFVTSDVGHVTNQEMFDEMIASEGGLITLLNLVDDVVLPAHFCASRDELEEVMTSLKADIGDLEAWMAEQGFASEDEIITIITRGLLRQDAAYRTVDVTEEDIQAAFELFFGDDETADLEEVRDQIHEHLVGQQMDQTEGLFAELRHEAGFVIYNEVLADAYERYLNRLAIDVDVQVAEPQAQMADVIARVGDDDITVGQLFAALTSDFGLQAAFELVDPVILGDQFEVDPAAVEAAVDELKDLHGDDFDQVISSWGFASVDALFDYFEVALLPETAFRATFTPTEERLRELHDQMGETVSGSHILVDHEELAVDLISQLQEAEEDDLSALFAELAVEYSSDPSSAAAGGDLGSWEHGQMVVEFDDAIFALEVGEFTTEPVETQFGYHIIYKTGGGAAPDFDAVRDELETEELISLEQAGALTSLLMDLRIDANMTFTNPLLQTRFEFMRAQVE